MAQTVSNTNRPVKRTADSLAEQVHVLTMKTLNGNARLSGMQLMEWVDEVSVVAARRHAGSDVTTMRVEDLRFFRAAVNKDTVVVKGKLLYAGTSSMQVSVNVYIERFSGTQTLIAASKVWLVALDADEQPCTVPALLPETDEERAAFRLAEQEKATLQQNR